MMLKNSMGSLLSDNLFHTFVMRPLNAAPSLLIEEDAPVNRKAKAVMGDGMSTDR